jgi:hypothetical protein
MMMMNKIALRFRSDVHLHAVLYPPSDISRLLLLHWLPLLPQAIWLELQDAVHAVDSMTTKTPAEAAKA